MRFRGTPVLALAAGTWVALLSCAEPLEAPPQDVPPGTLEITVATQGVEPDTNGYLIRLDTASARWVPNSTEIIRKTVPAGSHLVQMDDLAAHCSAQGENPRTVTVQPGTTVGVNFVVSCAATGVIQFQVNTTGEEPDTDGYVLTLDGGRVRAIVGVNSRHELKGLTKGAHILELGGIAPNCSADPGDSIQVEVTAEPATLALSVKCFTAGMPGWNAIAVPAGIQTMGVWASSPSDIFVVGGRDPYRENGLILHYDGKRWTEQFRAQGPIMGLWGTSTYSLFAAGDWNLLLRYDGRDWSRVNLLSDRLETYNVVWGAPRRMFFGGSQDGEPSQSFLRAYDGTDWVTLYEHSFVGGRSVILDIEGTSYTDVYVVGRTASWGDTPPDEDYARHVIRHYDGSGWTTSFESVTYFEPGEQFYPVSGVWANTTTDVFAVGDRSAILHFDGTTWTPMETPISERLRDVWGTSHSNVYAAGTSGVLHYNGAVWSRLGAPRACPWSGLGGSGNCISGTATDVFIVGDGAILHGKH